MSVNIPSKIASVLQDESGAIEISNSDQPVGIVKQIPLALADLSYDEDGRLHVFGGSGGGSVPVIDSLGSTSSTSALSANMGRELNERIYGLNDTFVAMAGSTMTGALLLNGPPTSDLMAANKKYIDDIVSYIETNALTFKGFISTTQPAIDVREGNDWYESANDPPDTNFPWSVKTFRDGVWSEETTEYMPVALDVFTNIDTNNSYFYAGDSWHILDFNGSTFDPSYFEIVNGVVTIKDGSISDALIAVNANIAQSKIDGLADLFSNGTWTPVLRGSTSNPTYTPTIATGFWWKVGRIVICNAVMDSRITTAGSGNITLDGLPFTSNATPSTYVSGSVAYSVGTNKPMGIVLDMVTGTLRLMRSSGSSVAQTSWADDYDGSGAMRLCFQIIYLIAE